MDPASFDRLTRFVSAARSRRSLGGLGLGVLGSLLAVDRTAAKRCPKGRKKCKKKCISKKKCCTNANCKPKATHKVCRGGRCVCAPGFKPCPGGRCIPAAGCCTACPAGQVCQGGSCCVATTAGLQAALAAGPATIQLCPSTTFVGTFTINRNVTVLGAGPSSSILDGGGSGPVVTIGTGTQVGLALLGIRNGRADDGGGILNDGTLGLSNVAITNNEGNNEGGGIRNRGPLAMVNSELIGNNAPDGGAIATGSNMTLTGCRFLSNQATGGGAISLTGALITLTNCELIGNDSVNGGGGIENDSGTIILDNSRLTGNTATNPSGQGGAIDTAGGQLELKNGTVIGGATTGAANRAASGAGIFVTTGFVTVDGTSRIIGNVASSTAAGTAGGIQLFPGSDPPTLEPGSIVSGNAPCDCNFNNVACANLICPT